MKKQYLHRGMIVVCLLIGLLAFSSSGLAQAPQTDDGALIRLQVATFDPLQAEPAVPANLKLSAYAEAGPYIVQFSGPVDAAWSEAVIAAGGQPDGYLPDNAFIVRLDQDSLARVKGLDFVRWVGLYQPAYKISPRLTAPSPTHLYRVQLAGWANSAEVSGQIAALSKGVSGHSATLLVSAEFEQLAQIAQLPDVLWIEPFQFFEKHNDVAGGIMGFNSAWSSGYTGAGQIVTIADTGLDTGVDTSTSGDIHADFDNRVTHIHSWPVPNVPTCYANAGTDDGADDEESGHGTHVAGSVAGNGARSGNLYRGAAYQANITFQAVEQYNTFTGDCSDETPGYYLTGIPTDISELFLQAYNWGSRIHTNSWGGNANGAYTVDSRNADQFIWNHKNFTILFSAGNEGVDDDNNGFVDQDSMGSPATAKNVITIGASDNERSGVGYTCTWSGCWPYDYSAAPTGPDTVSDNRQELAAFSSRGPTDDGRIKPDLVAPGTNILSTRSSRASETGWGLSTNSYYMYMGGTSMATPLAAGATAVVRDYLVDGAGLTNPSAALIKAILINSAVDISGYGNTAQEAGLPIPNNHEGWGRLNLASAVNGTNRALVDDHALTTGKTDVYTFTATGSATPFKVSVVWSDYPGSTSALVQLVNNLNLKVTAPNGSTTYWGNRFSAGWSTTGGSADTVNNVENVYIQSPATGQWKIEVIGATVSHGPQPYALVVRGQGTLVSPPPNSINYVYLPVIIKAASGPQPGLWRSNTGDEFYVTTDRASVNKFAIYLSITNCGNYKITHNKLEPISNNSFSFTGSFYASGTFNSATTAGGTDGLNNFYISGCGYINGGPWNWSATWRDSSQPTFYSAQVVEPDGVEPVVDVDAAKSDITVTRLD